MMDNEAMKHLGNVLTILADLHQDDRCRALDEAMAFYNRRNPNAQVEPIEGYVSRLKHSGPLQRLLDGDRL